MKAKTKKKILKGLWIGVGVLVLIVAIQGIFIYKRLYTTNIKSTGDYLYIPTGSDFNDVVDQLKKKNLILDEKSFRWTATQMKYVGNVKPGRYKLKPEMSNRELVSLLRSGKQIPVKLVFNNIRTQKQLTESLSKQLEVNANALSNLLNDNEYMKQLGFNAENSLSLFIPNTYEIYWNTSADQLLSRMKREYDKFWTSSRIAKAQKANLNPIQVSIIASIVQQESNKEDERPVIAGVYINRFRKDWKLEADPTLVYALGDFTINRVLNVYKSVESPYNTYLHKGLPPGPICLPSSRAIDAVLNYKHHDFMYFCAKEDFSGYHNFAVTYQQHLTNAKKFQQALDKRGIKS